MLLLITVHLDSHPHPLSVLVLCLVVRAGHNWSQPLSAISSVQ